MITNGTMCRFIVIEVIIMSLVVEFKSDNLELLDKKIKAIEFMLEKETSTVTDCFFEQKKAIDILKKDEFWANEQRYNQENNKCLAVPRSWAEYKAYEPIIDAAMAAREQCIEKRCVIQEEHAQLLKNALIAYENKLTAIQEPYLQKLAMLNDKRQQFVDTFDEAKKKYLRALNELDNNYRNNIANITPVKAVVGQENRRWLDNKIEIETIASVFIQKFYDTNQINEIDGYHNEPFLRKEFLKHTKEASEAYAIATRCYQEQCLAIDLDICALLYSMIPSSISAGSFSRFFNATDDLSVNHELNVSVEEPRSPRAV